LKYRQLSLEEGLVDNLHRHFVASIRDR
jgi:hypothetical protein